MTIDGITDMEGKPMSPVTVEFTTSTADVDRPEIVFSYPEDKQKDIGQKDRVYGGARRFGERTIFGTEVKANISEKWQVYSRMATVNAQVDTWSTLMAHVGYFISPRAEIYVEFGSGWHTDNDLTNDNDIADNIREIDQKLFFVTRVSF